MDNEETSLKKIIGDYRILRQLGEGGMGRVYEAEHVLLGVRRAVKVFSSESNHAEFLRRRFLSEGRILSDLRHDRIVRVYNLSIDESTGSPYFAMDLITSPTGDVKSLADELKDGNLDEDKISEWFFDICDGLDYIHSKGVVHRDISLDNILIGNDGRIVISDFGISRIVDSEYRQKIDMTATIISKNGNFCMGKGNYMAPELKRGGEATPASDAWALGVLLFRLLSGYWYEEGKIDKTRDLLSAYELPWFSLIKKLCSKNPDSRIPEEGFAGLKKILKLKSATFERERGKNRKKRKSWIVAILMIALTAFAIFAIVRYGFKEDSSRDTVSEKYEEDNPLSRDLKKGDDNL